MKKLEVVIQGGDIEENSVIWFFAYAGRNKGGYRDYYARRTLKLKNDHDIDHLEFIYNPIDGLHATSAVRKFWSQNPHENPYATLFDILQHKLT